MQKYSYVNPPHAITSTILPARKAAGCSVAMFPALCSCFTVILVVLDALVYASFIAGASIVRDYRDQQESTKKMGRPKLPKGQAKGRIAPIRFTEAELKLYVKEVKASNQNTLSGWV